MYLYLLVSFVELADQHSGMLFGKCERERECECDCDCSSRNKRRETLALNMTKREVLERNSQFERITWVYDGQACFCSGANVPVVVVVEWKEGRRREQWKFGGEKQQVKGGNDTGDRLGRLPME